MHLYLAFLLLTVFTLLHFPPAISVSIRLRALPQEEQPTWAASQICSEIPAGVCCRRLLQRRAPNPTETRLYEVRHSTYRYADYAGLDAMSLALIWDPAMPRGAPWPQASGCGGKVQYAGRAPIPLEASMATNVHNPWHGPGTLNYISPFSNDERFTGAMWVRLSESDPSLGAVEGSRGFLSGGVLAKRGTYEEEDQRQRQTGSRTLDIPVSKDTERSGHVDEKQGLWVWPNVLEVGGVEYHRTGKDEMVFRSKEGKVFDLAQLDH